MRESELGIQGQIEQYTAQYARHSSRASCRCPSPCEEESCQPGKPVEMNAAGAPSACFQPHEVARQPHGRKHARDRNGTGAPTRPHTKKGQWSEEEEMILATQHLEVGNKWAAISKHLPLRSDNDVKNHWNSTLRSKSQQKHCTFLWLYAKDVEPVADSDAARRQCFEAATHTYQQLQGTGCSAAPANQHLRAVRRGASSTTLAPRQLTTTPASRSAWCAVSDTGVFNSAYERCTGTEETEDSQCLSAEHMGGTDGVTNHHSPMIKLEPGLHGEQEEAAIEEKGQQQFARRSRGPRAGDSVTRAGSNSDSMLFMMPTHQLGGSSGMHAHGNDTGVRPAPTTGFDMLGSIGENSWEMPVMDTAGRATQWPHNARAMWPDGPCPSPGLPAVTHPGVSLEDAIAMDLEDNSFEGLDVATFLRMRNSTADQLPMANFQNDACPFPLESDMMNSPTNSAQAAGPSSYSPAPGAHFLGATSSRDPSSDRSSGLTHTVFGSMGGGCNSATAGTMGGGFFFSAQPQSGNMAGFMPVAATTTPDLLGLGLSHQQDGLQAELEQQQAAEAPTAAGFGGFGQAAGGAASGGGGWAPSASSNAFNVLGLSPRAASIAGTAASRNSRRPMARHSLDLPLHSTLKGRGPATSGTLGTNQQTSGSSVAFNRSLQRYASVNAGPGGSHGGMSAFGTGRHQSQPCLQGEAMPLDPNDPGSGDGSSVPGTAVAHRHTSPVDQLAVNSAACGGQDGVSAADYGESCGPNATALPSQLPWAGMDGSCLAGASSDGPANGPSRVNWHMDNAGQQQLWASAAGLKGGSSGMIAEDECGGIKMEPWEPSCEQWAAVPEHQLAVSDTMLVSDAPRVEDNRRASSKPGSSLGLAGREGNAPQINANNATVAPPPPAPSAQAPPPPGPRLIIHSLPKTSKWNTAVAAAKGWPTAPYNKRQHH